MMHRVVVPLVALVSVMSDLIRVTSEGLYCEQGGFYIDPWKPVDRAIITHAHADHARPGNRQYLTARQGLTVLRTRLGTDANIETVEYGEELNFNGVRVSLHPAGHVLGSAQVRVEWRGEVCVVSGDYKLTADSTCAAFEPLRCHTFVTECTFGLPIYRWPEHEQLFAELNGWWRANREQGRASVVFAYALGKAQRVLAGVDPAIGPLFCHGAVEKLNAAYRAAGIPLPPTEYTGRGESKRDWAGALIVAPPSAIGSAWLRKFGPAATAFASGWMRIRGMRRRRAVSRGFVLSDHADWPGLVTAVRETEATRILATHGRSIPFVRWLREQGLDAWTLETEYVGERDDMEVDQTEVDQLDTSDDDPPAAGDSA